MCACTDLGQHGGNLAMHTWQKIIPDEHAEQDKVINDALHVEGKWQHIVSELQLQVLSQKPNLEQDETLLTRVL